MGGLGSGGARLGTGPKPKGAKDKALGGFAGHRTNADSRDRAKSAEPLPVMAPPDDLQGPSRVVWLELAPFAAAQRTLIPAMALAFRKLCENVVLERAIFDQIQADGMTSIRVTTDVTSGEQHIEKKAHALFPRHTAMLQRVEAGLTRFRLAPIGKEIVAEKSDGDEWAEFDGNPQ